MILTVNQEIIMIFILQEKINPFRLKISNIFFSPGQYINFSKKQIIVNCSHDKAFSQHQ